MLGFVPHRRPNSGDCDLSCGKLRTLLASGDARCMHPQLREVVRRWRGVIPTRALIEAGWTYRQLAAFCATGELRRVRQGWLAVSEADPALLAAAVSGGVVTCVTQASRLGLWELQPSMSLHIGIPTQSRRPPPDGLRLHWASPLVDRDTRQLEDNLANVLAAVAACLPIEDALAVWESALNKKLIELSELRGLPLKGNALELAKYAHPLSDSGLESMVRWRLRRFKMSIRAQAWILGHHVDFLIGERLVLQVDGGHHVGKQRTRDIAHDGVLMVNGYHVIRVGYEQVVHNWPEVQDLILRAVAQGLS